MNRHTFKDQRDAITWKSSQRDMQLYEMEESHLKNTIVLLFGKQEAYDKIGLGDYMYEGRPANEWISILKQELEYRKKPEPVEVKNFEITL